MIYLFNIIFLFLGYLVQDTSSFKTDEACLMFKNGVNIVVDLFRFFS